MYKRTDKEFILDMYEACRRIREYTKNTDFNKFSASEVIQDAVIRNIEILGEAVKNVSHKLQEKYPEVEWRIIARTRDKLIHFYFGIDIETVWKIITFDIPVLEEKLKNIIKKEGWEEEL